MRPEDLVSANCPWVGCAVEFLEQPFVSASTKFCIEVAFLYECLLKCLQFFFLFRLDTSNANIKWNEDAVLCP